MQRNLATFLLQEDSYWKQRSNVFWLSDGDTNSKFFHASASTRKRRNIVKKLQDFSRNWVTAHEDLCHIVRNYFIDIFAARQGDPQPIISYVQPVVIEEDNSMLT